MSHLRGCVGFWLWVLVGAGGTFGAISLGVLAWIPMAALAFLLLRRSDWKEGPVLLGILAGAGAPLLLVAGLQWDSWHHRTLGDNTPNPYGWGGIGLALFLAGIAAFAVRGRRTR